MHTRWASGSGRPGDAGTFVAAHVPDWKTRHIVLQGAALYMFRSADDATSWVRATHSQSGTYSAQGSGGARPTQVIHLDDAKVERVAHCAQFYGCRAAFQVASAHYEKGSKVVEAKSERVFVFAVPCADDADDRPAAPFKANEVPEKVAYHPCRSLVRPYPSFTARDLARSAQAPEKDLVLEHVFAFETEANFGPNLIALDERTIVYSASTLVVLHDIEANTQKYFRGHDGQVSTLAISGSGRLLASGQSGSKPYFLLWSAEDGKPRTWTYQKDDSRLHRMRLGPVVPLGAPSVLAIAFSPDEKFVAAVGADGEHMMGIWSVATGELVIEKSATRSTPPGIAGLVWHQPDHLFSIGREAHFKCWDCVVVGNVDDLSLGGKAGVLGDAPDSSMLCVLFDASLGVLYTGGELGSIYLWSAEQCVHSVEKKLCARAWPRFL